MSFDSGTAGRKLAAHGERLGCAIIAAAALLGPGVISAAAQCQFQVTVVTGPPCFPDPNISIGLEGINDLGQACGWQAICGQVGAKRPLVWTEELGIILMPLPEGATRGVANDINNVLGSDGFGQVACTISGGTIGGDKPFLYDDGVWTQIQILPGTVVWDGTQLNDHAEVVGGMNNPIDGPLQAFHWNNGLLTPLDLPLGPDSAAGAINGFSVIAGWMGASIINNEGFLLSASKVEAIPLLPNAITGIPDGLNSDGIATGNAIIEVKSGPAPRRSWVYYNGQLVNLGVFADTHRIDAEDINDANQIVGTSFGEFGGGNAPFLWQDGQLTRLRDLIELPPQVLGFANVKAINNRGQIVGMSGGASHGLVLTPIVPLGDVNLDCEVDGGDLAIVLRNWGPDKLGDIADIVTNATFQPPGDGVVDGADLAVVLGNWTEQPSTSSRRN